MNGWLSLRIIPRWGRSARRRSIARKVYTFVRGPWAPCACRCCSEKQHEVIRVSGISRGRQMPRSGAAVQRLGHAAHAQQTRRCYRVLLWARSFSVTEILFGLLIWRRQSSRHPSTRCDVDQQHGVAERPRCWVRLSPRT